MQHKLIEEIAGVDTPVCFRAIKGSKVESLVGTYPECAQRLDELNENKYEVYWIVNGGGYTAAEITSYRALYVDMDAGRGEDGEYLSLDAVRLIKDKFLARIDGFSAKPTGIVETRNGYHVYWRIDGCTPELWQRAQDYLVRYFEADPSASKPAQLLRVPAYNWHKTSESYMVWLIQLDDDGWIYEPVEMMIATGIRPGEITSTYDSELGKLEYAAPEHRYVGSHLSAIRRGEYTLSNIYDTKGSEPIIVDNSRELYDFLCSKNILDYLGFNRGSFRCPFHDDAKKSGSSYYSKSAKAGDKYPHYMLKCHGECNKAWNIISLTERIRKCKRREAIDYLCKVYNVRLRVETEWMSEQREIIRSNKEYLLSGAMQYEHPDLYKRIARYVPLLNLILDHASMSVRDNNRTRDNRIVWFGSLSYYQGLSRMSNLTRLNERVNIMALLNLLQKLPDSEIPHALLEESNAFRKSESTEHITFWSVSEYCDELLTKSNEYARMIKDHNFTVKGMGREWIVRSLGEEVAERVYPQQSGKALSRYSDEYAIKCAEIAMRQIEKSGYTTEARILKAMNKANRDERRLKRVLDEILQSYTLARVRITKALKESLGITEPYGGFAIMKKA